ncbi:MAG: hypothetical protein Q8O03_05500 [Nanoarchaeota archaeon]|nr:hypothetical protein [Nanoarchaeota archaeon]
MKVPKTFIPEYDVEDKTNSLLNPPKKIELEELILVEDSGVPHFISQEDLPIDNYKDFDPSKIEKAIYVDYGSPVIDIIKFRDKNYLAKNTDKVKSLVEKHNSEKLTQNLFALIKDEYVIFLYAESKNPGNYASQEVADFKTKAINFYKENFGFEEVEQ